MKNLVKFAENRVRRNYTGGAATDMLRRKSTCVDNNKPEDWIASTVNAGNPDMEPVENEGLSTLEDGRLFRDFLSEAPEHYLGKAHYSKFGIETGFLTKILDSAVRLCMQGHPSRDFSRKHLNSKYGKLEVYYIFSVRPGIDPYIWLGFQRAPSREEWTDIVLKQDSERLSACFDKVPVKPGDVWFIPGGMPHAIGEGVLMIEIMEPSDWCVRCEFDPARKVDHKQTYYMGLEPYDAMGIFNYTSYSVEEVTRNQRVTPAMAISTPEYTYETLITPALTDCFTVDKLTVLKNCMIDKTTETFYTGVVTKGAVTVSAGEDTLELKAGESFFVSAACDQVEYRLDSSKAEVLVMKPGPGA
ncbi:mannose-6-phosphate isomerase [Oscillospiraceae bacterium MB08-C2-2]|nr:mannose-6-phosphate isomerase [Oscillospiraceae bacterium MB08-C2-2]